MRTFAASAGTSGPLRAGPPRLIRDVMPAVATFVATLGLLHGGDHSGGGARPVSALAVALAAVASAPLVLRRRAPLAVFTACAVPDAVLAALGRPHAPPFATAVALLLLASDRRTRDRLETVAAVVLGMLGVYIAGQSVGADAFSGTQAVGAIAIWGGAWIVGEQVRQRRQRFADSRERTRTAARDREREGRLAAAEERTRIARDLHDSAAHSINVILVQAGAARLLQERDPEAVRKALVTIEDVARETITEIDRLVRGLRAEDADVEDVEPPAGLAALATLVEQQRAAGSKVEARINGERRPLAPGLDQAAFRIVQESLTNAARHGLGAATAVTISFKDEALELTIENEIGAPSATEDIDGNGITGAPGGHGILGMRERATLLGGTLEAGVVGGRFRVHARMLYTGGGR